MAVITPVSIEMLPAGPATADSVTCLEFAYAPVSIGSDFGELVAAGSGQTNCTGSASLGVLDYLYNAAPFGTWYYTGFVSGNTTSGYGVSTVTYMPCYSSSENVFYTQNIYSINGGIVGGLNSDVNGLDCDLIIAV